ncbi:MAG: 3'-5' exonuclease [Sarcina sp.]
MILGLGIVVLIVILVIKNNRNKIVKSERKEEVFKSGEVIVEKDIVSLDKETRIESREDELSKEKIRKILDNIHASDEADIERRMNEKIEEKVAYLESLKTAKLYDLDEVLDVKYLTSIKSKKEIETDSFMKVLGTRERPSSYVLLDVETTGLDECRCEIIQIKAVRIRYGEATEIFNTYVKPMKRITDRITSINRISNDDVKDAMSIEMVLPRFIKFVGKDVIVGHNVEFDMRFILASAYKLGYKRLTNKTIDTLKICKSKLRETEYDWEKDTDRKVSLNSYKLNDLASYFDTEHIEYEDNLKSLKVCDSIYKLMKDVDTRYVMVEDIAVFEVDTV